MRTTFQNFLLPQLGVAKSDDPNLHHWIRSNRFSSAKLIDNCWHLEAYSEIELYKAFTPDFQRFAFSSFETFSLANLEWDHCFSTSWPLLKLYYSAFFAAHALTRATGNGHINLDRRVVGSVNDYLSLINVPEQLSSGSYKVSLKEGDRNISLVLEASTEGSGVHDNFWRYFCTYLDDLATQAINDALPSANSFLSATNALKSCIKDNSRAGVWFSATRNAINYRHEFDCWLPNNKGSPIRKLDFPSNLGDPDMMEAMLGDRPSDLVRLINLSTYLASLNHHTILMVKNEIRGNSPFTQKWRRLETAILEK